MNSKMSQRAFESWMWSLAGGYLWSGSEDLMFQLINVSVSSGLSWAAATHKAAVRLVAELDVLRAQCDGNWWGLETPMCTVTNTHFFALLTWMHTPGSHTQLHKKHGQRWSALMSHSFSDVSRAKVQLLAFGCNLFVLFRRPFYKMFHI